MTEENNSGKKRILIFCEFFRPSTKSGGGMWSVVNLVDRFCDRYDFFVVTRNHESRNDLAPFATVKTGSWNDIAGAKAFYLAPREVTATMLASLVNEVQPDGVFLNSVFSIMAVNYLRARRRGMVAKVPVVLAPCGELTPGALHSKRWKKLPFLLLARLFGLYKNLIWKASTETEVEDIRSIFGKKLTPMIAPDLSPPEIIPKFSTELKPCKESGSMKLVFMSRIDRKKNLEYLIERLAFVTEGSVEFNIIGPHEDAQYWLACKQKIDRLPPNIKVNIVGAVSYLEGLNLLTENHFFALPTLGENFGYVMLEALAAGCPLIVSQHTIWGRVVNGEAGWVIPLEDREAWVKALRNCISMNHEEFEKLSQNAREIAVEWLRDPSVEVATGNVLKFAFGQ
jgi:glycosyltransferase involved in cell wall biosynthesis